jgi:hypothetical protein
MGLVAPIRFRILEWPLTKPTTKFHGNIGRGTRGSVLGEESPLVFVDCILLSPMDVSHESGSFQKLWFFTIHRGDPPST